MRAAAPCSTYKTSATCGKAPGGKRGHPRCTWANGKCGNPPPPPPPPPLPVVPPTPAPKCAAGSKPLQVFIMMGQSNMLGEGKIGDLSNPSAINHSLAQAVTEGKYPYLYDKATKNWTTSKTVRNVFVMGSGGVGTSATQTNAWMNGGQGHRGSIGPELGIGGTLEAAMDTEPIMMLKSCIGDRALGWDLLPPGQKGYTYNNFTYAGYHQVRFNSILIQF